TLSKDLSNLLDEEEEYNVLITAGTDDNAKTFKAHTVILRSRSAYFRNALSNIWARKESNYIVFTKPNISPDAFDVILKYIYGATIDLPAIDMPILLEILIATDELCLTELAASLNDSFKHLQLFCMEIIQNKPNVVFKAKDFVDIGTSLLTTLLERSNLLMPEIDVWDALIKWGMFNTSPPLDPNYKTWPKDSFEKLQETLIQFIPLINFTVISSSDFYHKILPFQLVLPTDLFKDLLKFHLVPQITPSHPALLSPKRNQLLQSIFINNTHTAWIMSQVDSKLYNGNNQKLFPYDLKLLIRGSNGGMSDEAFHMYCDQKDVNKSIISIVMNPSKAIRNTHGPSFGDGDLWVKVSTNFTKTMALPSFCRQKSYTKKILDLDKFFVEDYEVFQIIKKTNVIYL
ncbi:10758_t:CDS:2, partial [Scutellospora calospora]